MEQDFYFSMNCIDVNVDRMKMNVSQSKNGIMINANVDVKNYLIGLHVKNVKCTYVGS